MRKTIYEIVNNKSGELIETYLFPVGIKLGNICNKKVYSILDDKTGEFIGFNSSSIRVRVRLVDIDEYRKTHSVIDSIG